MNKILKGNSVRCKGMQNTPILNSNVINKHKKHGFTLAEMMVVMLILSIVLAAMAPVMTTRNKSDYSSPWRYATNGSDAYFAGNANSNQVAMIGQHEVGTGENDARLILRTAQDSGWSHLMFKTGDTIVGRLYLDENNLYLSNANPSGENNTVFGVDALKNNVDGKSNVVIGYQAGIQNTTGNYNNIVGSKAVTNSPSSFNNSVLGYSALNCSSGTHHDNVAIGYFANNYSDNGVTPIGTIAIGSFSQANSKKSIAIGTGTYSSELAKTTAAFAENSIALGASARAGENNSGTLTGLSSIAIGSLSHTVGDFSIAIGNEAIADKQYSIAIGDEAETHGENSLAIGSYLANVYGENSIAIGNEAKIGTSSTSALNSISIGANSSTSLDNSISIGANSSTSLDNSISIGANSSTSLDNSISIGYKSNVPAQRAIAIGSLAEVSAGTVINYGPVAIGYNSKASGSGNISVGYNSSSVGDGSIAIGSHTGVSAPYAVSVGSFTEVAGEYGVALGYSAKSNGYKNVAIGYNSCNNVTGDNKVCIGADSGPKSGSSWASDDIERIFIGSKSKFDGGTAVLEVHNDPTEEGSLNYYNINKTAVVVHGALVVTGPIYNNAKATGSSSYKDWKLLEYKYLPGTSTYDAVLASGDNKYYYNEYINDVSSDRRLKYVGKESTAGLDKIRQLKVFNYTFKKDEKKTPHVGVIAQDLQKVFPNAVKKGVDGFLTIRMEDMFYAVINAIKELDSRVTKLEKENQELKARIERLEAKIK